MPQSRLTVVIPIIGTALLFGVTSRVAGQEVTWQSRSTSAATNTADSESDPEPASAAESVGKVPAETVAPLPPTPPSVVGPSIAIEGLPLEEQLDGLSEAQDESTYDLNLMFTEITGGGDAFGLFSVESRRRHKLSIREPASLATQPGWAITWLNGPSSTDLPPQLYQFTIPFETNLLINDESTLSLWLTLGWFTDGENRRPEMFRVLGTAAYYHRLNESTQWGAGLLYLDRDDIPALPLLGMVFGDEADSVRYELMFPRPRVVWRVSETDSSTRWVYVLGELGGNSWAIKREDRTPDVLTYRDLRLVGGLECEGAKGHRAVLEAGWVFDRAIETRTGRGDYDPTDAFLVRVWLQY